MYRVNIPKLSVNTPTPRRWRLAAIAATAVLALVVSCSDGIRQKAHPSVAGPSPIVGSVACPLDRAGLDNLVNRLKPHVEREAGRVFLHEPVVRLATRDELSTALAAEFEAHYALDAEPPEMRYRLQAWTRRQAEDYVPHVLAFFSRVDGSIYFSAARALTVVRRAGGEGAACGAVATSLMAHQLAHALQAQHVDIAAHLELCHESQARDWYTSRVEGHAFAIQDAVDRALGLEPQETGLAQRISVGARVRDDARAPDLLGRLDIQYQEYMRVKRQVQALERSSADDGVWRWLERAQCDGAELDEMSR